MKLQTLILFAGTEQAAASSYSNLELDVVQCTSTTGMDSIEIQVYMAGIHGRSLTPNFRIFGGPMIVLVIGVRTSGVLD